MSSHHIHKKLRLRRLKHAVHSNRAEKKRKEQHVKNLEHLISGAPFLEDDQTRKQMWIAVIPSLTIKEMKELSGAIVRENFRYKKRERNLKFKKIPSSG